MSSNKGVSHKGNSEIAHAEAALGAGRPYEKPNEGHNEMFNTVKELEEHNKKAYGHSSNKQSRGERIDQELQEEDKRTIEKMNEAHKKKEESKHHKRED